MELRSGSSISPNTVKQSLGAKGKLLKEVQEVEHITNDTLCIEERIFGMFPLGIDCFNWSGALSQLFLTYRLQEMDISLNFCFIAIDFF